MWRHGDVLIAPIEMVPPGARQKFTSVLVYGELTGHGHRIKDPETADLWEIQGNLFLQVKADNATVVHEEHHPITLPRGTYRVWMQREYTPQAIRRILD